MCPKTMVNKNLKCNGDDNVYMHKVRTLLVGERDIVHSYLSGQKWKFGRIAKVLGRLHYMVKVDNRSLWHQHTDQIKKIGKRVEPQDIFMIIFMIPQLLRIWL